MENQISEALEEVFSDKELLVEEIKIPSKTVVTRDTKIKKAHSQLSTAAARSINDPLYKKMIYHRELYYKFRDAVHRKYGSRMRIKARR